MENWVTKVTNELEFSDSVSDCPHSQETQSGYVITGRLNPLIGCPLTNLKINSSP